VARVRLHQGEINQLLRAPGGAVHREVSKHTRRVTNLAKAGAPVDNGKLRASITSSVSTRGKRVVGRVWTPLKYGLWQHEGTGIYAGRGRIYPKTAKVLVFRPRKGRPQRRGARGSKGPVVFAKSVKGVPPKPYLVEALEAGCPWPLDTSSRL